MAGIGCVECAGRAARGFTLVELMVVIALLAGLALFMAPAFEQWRMRERVDARSRTLIGAMAFARAEAMRLGVRVTLCRSARDGGCLRPDAGCGAAGWSCDWAVHADVGGRGRVLRRFPHDPEVVVAGALRELAFTPPAGQVIGGFRRFEVGPRRSVSVEEQARASRCIRIAAGGRARVVAGRCEGAS